MMYAKKFYLILAVVFFAFVFTTTQALASLTFSATAITGTADSIIDLGSGHNLVLQTSGGKVGIGTATPGELLSLGLAGTTKGILSLSGETSGKIILQPAAEAGTYTLTFPTSAGSAGQVLTTNGSGTLSWTTVSGGGGADTLADVTERGATTTVATTFADLAARKLMLSAGTELVTNGNFTGNAAGWTLGGGGGTPDWAYGTNNVTHANGGGTTALQPTIPLASTVGKVYKVAYTITRSAGTVTVSLGGTADVARSSSGTYTAFLQTVTTGNLLFTPTTTFVGTIDDISVMDTDQLELNNVGPSTITSTVQRSPAISWESHVWDTDSAVDDKFVWRAGVLPVTGNTTTGAFQLSVSKNDAVSTVPFSVSENGVTVSVTGGDALYAATSLNNAGYAGVHARSSSSLANTIIAENTNGYTATIYPSILFRGATTGAGVTGFGLKQYWKLNSDTTTQQDAAQLDVLWADATHATRKAWMEFYVNDTTQHAAMRLKATGTSSAVETYGDTSIVDVGGGSMADGFDVETLTLSTIGATTDTTTNLLPATSEILAVTYRVTAEIAGAGVTGFTIGDGTNDARFCGAQTVLTAGATGVCLAHQQGSVATDADGAVQMAEAKVRVTVTGGTPTAGAIELIVWRHKFTAPPS